MVGVVVICGRQGAAVEWDGAVWGKAGRTECDV
jgi:hypothetical protein